jgi:hypothetical protein
MVGFFNWIGYFNGLDKKEKKKLTDIGLFGFSWIGKWFFSVDIWIILINVC